MNSRADESLFAQSRSASIALFWREPSLCDACQSGTATQPTEVPSGGWKRGYAQRSSDQVACLKLPGSIEHYPDRFGRVSYRDVETAKALVFLTNNFDLPALTIAQLYKARWRVELFFKWIKQNLRIKHSFGTTDNA